MALYDNAGQRSVSVGAYSHSPSRSSSVALLFSALTAIVDVGVIVTSSAVATVLYAAVSGVSVDVSRSRESALVIAALFVTLCIRDGSYRTRSLALPRSARVITKWAVSITLFLVIAFLFKSGAYYSRGVVLVLAPIGFVGLLAGRHVVARVMLQAIETSHLQPSRLAVIGATAETETMLRSRIAEDPHLDVVAFVPIPDDGNVRDGVQQAINLSQAGLIDEILIALPWSRMKDIGPAVSELRKQALPVMLLPDIESVGYISRPVQLGSLPTFELKRAALGPSDLLMKRSLDIVIALAALLVLWPVLLFAAIAIKLESPGPVIFRQRRHGFNNREFRIFKFRSMRVAEDGDAVRQAVRNDPRVTRVGAFLRRTSIDELPQLFNVIIGEMSIVGPRPHAVAHNEEWVSVVEGYARRHNILPGITGLAQVHGFRGQTDTPEKIDARVRLDLQYIEQWSLALDIKIILKTVQVLMFQKEAF